jgi:hypothetical protein
MNFETIVLLFIAGLFLAMLGLLEAGRRYGNAKRLKDSKGYEKGVGTVEGSIFGLLGLLIAFTFSGAASRFEDRKHLITQEANAIGTAYLRIDLLPTTAHSEMRELFRQYLDARIKTFHHGSNLAAAMELYNQSTQLQTDIWKSAVTKCQMPRAATDACKLLLPSLNEMIDITTTRLMSTRIHPPLTIYFLMSAMALLSALLVGYSSSGSKSRNLLHMIVFAFVMTITVYMIFDLEYPRLGLIRVDSFDQVLVELRSSMK